ncbi:MAG: hypothetical protein IPK63_18995 [Candidatus Competibacteraceae bacterium]|nr:hypothetical protein [Candidatus Competibacteraceae bacterium]
MHENHLIYTESGWIPASEITASSKVFYFAPVDAGTVMHKNKWGRQQVFVNGHQVKKRSIEEWDKKISKEVLASLPLCLCGCGEKQDSVTGFFGRIH